MKMNRLHTSALATLLAIGVGVGILPNLKEAKAAPSAREIMEKVVTTRKLDGSEAVVKMSIINEKGEKRERQITMATKLYDGGQTEKRLYRFLAPADVKGTGVLIYDYDKKADDTWIFLPALRKTRRVVSSQRAQSFMGSEFSYGDLNIPTLDEFDYKLVKEESAGGEPCFVIEVTPKSKDIASAEGYSKKLYWVSTKKFSVVQGHYFDMDGKLLKVLTSSNIKLLDPKNNRYRAMHMEMVNKQNGRKSVFDSEKVTFAPDTKDEYFTTRYLEQ